jgi:melibiose permease
MTDTTQEQRTSWGTKINYGIGAMGKSLSNGLTGRLTVYLLTVLHVPKAFLAPFLFCERIFDGVNDLYMGVVIDNTHSRFGKFRPWIAVGAITNALITVLLFARPAALGNGVFGLLYVAVTYVLWDLTYTMVDVSYYALIPALSSSPKQRDQLSAIPRVFSGVIGIVSAFNMSIIEKIGGGSDEAAMLKGFLLYAVFTSAVYILTSVYCAIMVKDPGVALRMNAKDLAAAQKNAAPERFTLRRAAAILLDNGQALVVVGVMILFNLACNLTNGMSQYYFMFVIGSKNQLGFFSIILGAAQGVGLFVFPALSRVFGRKIVYAASFLMPCAGYLIMAITGQAFPRQFIPLAVSAFAAFIGYGSMSVMQSVMLADAVDYGEHKTGQRNEGIIFSMLTFLSKLAGAFSELITMLVFFAVQFGGEDANTATPEAVKGIMFLMYVLPPVILLAALLLYKTKYKLTPEMMERVNRELRERKKELPLA